MFGQHNGAQLLYRIVHRIVDDKIIIVAGVLQLDLGAQQTLLHLFRGIGTAGGQTALQLLP